MEDSKRQISEILEKLSVISGSDEERGLLYKLQALQKETSKDDFLLAIKQGLMVALKKGNDQLVSVIEEIEPSILEQEDVKEELEKVNNEQKLKGWEV